MSEHMIGAQFTEKMNEQNLFTHFLRLNQEGKIARLKHFQKVLKFKIIIILVTVELLLLTPLITMEFIVHQLYIRIS